MNVYLPLLKGKRFSFYTNSFSKTDIPCDVVLTSPPYGDSRTTVAYGQYSTLSNEWMGFTKARKIDSFLMGGYCADSLYGKSVLADHIKTISKQDAKRALQVSAFYADLEESIKKVSNSIKTKGYAIYVVGNRTVKKVTLPTDQFVTEQFEKNGLKHLFTYQRNISSKVMPSKNSPTNVMGSKVRTMNQEHIVVCRKE